MAGPQVLKTTPGVGSRRNRNDHMAQRPAAQHRLVAGECVQRPPFSSLVGRAAVEHFYVMLLHCRRGSRTRKGDRHLAKHHQMDRPARVVAGEEQDMTTCKTCKHWTAKAPKSFAAKEIFTPTDPDIYKPMQMPFEVRECKHPRMTFCERPVEPNGFGVADGSEYMAMLITAEDFGCVRYEEVV